MTATETLAESFARLQREATLLAGNLRDVAQRATVYRQLFRESGRNHVFPLIAAHGALWASGHFARGNRVGWWLSWQYALSNGGRARRLAALAAFADAFRDINRRVCIDTYTTFHFTREHGDQPEAADFVPAGQLYGLRRMHEANRAGVEMSDDEKRELFVAHFLDEQAHVVGPAIEQAVAAFDWPILRWLALRPTVRFAYFGGGGLPFHDFSRNEERIANGLRAFDWARRVGWDAVETALQRYSMLPAEAFADPEGFYAALCGREAARSGPRE